MHPAAYGFVEAVLSDHPSSASGAILEIGSLDVNGTVRPLFASATRYHGIDIRAGRGVDEEIDCAEYDGEQAFDTVVSTEVLEHMPEPAELIACARRSLTPGGRLVLTMAAPFRAHHGVDGGGVGSEFYANITLEQLPALLDGWISVQIIHNAVAHDLYATAVKP